MTVLTWPSELPRPLRQNYRGSATDPRLRKKQDAPIPAYRRRYSSVARDMQLSLVIERFEKAVFDNFYEEACGFGTKAFWMPDPVTDGWPLLVDADTPLIDGAGQPILISARLLCIFGNDPPSETIRGMTFTTSFSVWVMP